MHRCGSHSGMHLLKVRVVDSEGNPPGIRRSIVRYIIPALSLLPWLAFLASPGFMLDLGAPVLIVLGAATMVLGVLDPLWMIWDAQKQTLHDKLASTFVVNVG
ncbi:MAG: RDD family protein [Thermomicrobiales bacterium]